MQAFEDNWNIILCVMLLHILSTMCFVAFSAITVQYTLHVNQIF
jgi:hypothetical protein